MALRNLKVGTRVVSAKHGAATVISHDSCEAMNRYPHLVSSENRRGYAWIKFDNGMVNAYFERLPEEFTLVLTLEDKVKQAERALEAAKAELEAFNTPKAGQRWSSGEFTATVKLVEDGFVFYTYITAKKNLRANVRGIENFIENYRRLCDC